MTNPKRFPIIDMPHPEQIEMVNKPYSDEDLSVGKGLENEIEKLMKFFNTYGIDYDKFSPTHHDKKKAYPNFDQYIYIPGQRDTNKWLNAVKDIYYRQKGGTNYSNAIRQATTGWDKMETYDFLNWLRFYEEGAHMKYKYAQVWYENGQPGYFLHIKPDDQTPVQPVVDGNAVNDAREEANRNEEKKQTIEKQRQKIIGRLDSAEKLLRSPEGQMFAGLELENLMEAIYSLKKKVQLVNKLSISTRLYEDMIIREANVLCRKGFVKAADMLYSVAEENIPTTTSPEDPSGAGNPGTPGTLPAQMPGVPNAQTPANNDGNQNQPPASAIKGPPTPSDTIANGPAVIPQDIPVDKLHPAISEFNKSMEGDDAASSDIEVEDDQLEVSDQEDVLLVTEAQIGAPPIDEPMTTTPPPAPGNPVPAPILPPEEGDEKTNIEEPLEVTEDDIKPSGDQSLPPTSDFDSKVDEVFKNVTIIDVVAKLEDISKSYKTRDMPRQLGIIDMMLKSLGLASMFPSLSEAQNKALEANNYISTRVDDILSKLRGAMVGQEKAPESVEERPDVTGIKNKLQNDEDKEKARKQMRKEQAAAELEEPAKETPKVEMGELGPPPSSPPATPPVPRPLV